MDRGILYASAYRPCGTGKYHEGLIVCSACLGGEIPRRITAGQFAEAEEAIQWYKNLFGDDFYLELQRHKATVPRANHETYKLQEVVNQKLVEYSKNIISNWCVQTMYTLSMKKMLKHTTV